MIDELQQKCHDCAEAITQTALASDPDALAAIERNRDAYEAGIEAGIGGAFMALRDLGLAGENAEELAALRAMRARVENLAAATERGSKAFLEAFADDRRIPWVITADALRAALWGDDD